MIHIFKIFKKLKVSKVMINVIYFIEKNNKK